MLASVKEKPTKAEQAGTYTCAEQKAMITERNQTRIALSNGYAVCCPGSHRLRYNLLVDSALGTTLAAAVR